MAPVAYDIHGKAILRLEIKATRYGLTAYWLGGLGWRIAQSTRMVGMVCMGCKPSKACGD